MLKLSTSAPRAPNVVSRCEKPALVTPGREMKPLRVTKSGFERLHAAQRGFFRV